MKLAVNLTSFSVFKYGICLIWLISSIDVVQAQIAPQWLQQKFRDTQYSNNYFYGYADIKRTKATETVEYLRNKARQNSINQILIKLNHAVQSHYSNDRNNYKLIKYQLPSYSFESYFDPIGQIMHSLIVINQFSLVGVYNRLTEKAQAKLFECATDLPKISQEGNSYR